MPTRTLRLYFSGSTLEIHYPSLALAAEARERLLNAGVKRVEFV